ncbi:mechanosensitive ion channel family protein [bacterium]|nr:mechanosensitive ion channel family protein [bacterium]
MDFMSSLSIDALQTWIISMWPQILRILIIIIGLFVLGKIVKAIGTKIANKASLRSESARQQIETVKAVLFNALNVAIWALGLMLIMDELGIAIGPIIAAVGVLGLAVGFGAQSLVEDIITGFFILVEGQIRVGDVVEAGGKAGLVESISLRIVTLRDFSGNVHVIPHSEISVVTNMSKEFSRAVIHVGTAYREDAKQVMTVLMEEAQKLKADPAYSERIIEEPEVFGIDDFGDSDLKFRVRFHTKPLEQWAIARDFRIRIKERFDAENIEIPFPHSTIYFGEDKANNAPPMYVNLTQNDKGKGTVAVEHQN